MTNTIALTGEDKGYAFVAVEKLSIDGWKYIALSYVKDGEKVASLTKAATIIALHGEGLPPVYSGTIGQRVVLNNTYWIISERHVAGGRAQDREVCLVRDENQNMTEVF